MVATRRTQASATPPTTPSQERHHGETMQVDGTSNKKMNREIQRLMIDGNAKMGGSGSSSRRGRRHPLDQSPAIDDDQDPRRHRELSTGGVLLTPSPSDRDVAGESMPPPPSRKSSAQPQPQHPQPQPQSPEYITVRPALPRKRTIADYFSKKVPESEPKRRKIASPTRTVPAATTSRPTPPPAKSAVVQKSPQVTRLPSEVPAEVEVKEEGETVHVSTVPREEKKEGETARLSVATQEKELPTEQQQQQPEQAAAAEKEQPTGDAAEKEQPKEEAAEKEQPREEAAEKEQPPGDAEAGAKAKTRLAREARRLQIDANAALLGPDEPSRKRKRHTTFPPVNTAAVSASPTSKPNKRARHSLPAPTRSSAATTPTPSGSSPAAPPVSFSSPAPTPTPFTKTSSPSHMPTREEPQTTGKPVPTPPVLHPNNNQPRLLPSGETNPKWTKQWLAWLGQLADRPPADVAQKVKAEVAEERPRETEEEKIKRIKAEIRMLEAMPVISSVDEQAGPKSSPPQKSKGKKGKKQPPPPRTKKQETVIDPGPLRKINTRINIDGTETIFMSDGTEYTRPMEWTLKNKGKGKAS